MKNNVVALLVVIILLALAAVANAQGPWSLTTNDTRIGFSLLNGLPAISELKGTDANAYNWATEERECSLPTKVAVNGKVVNANWIYDGAASGSGQLEFSYHCSSPRMTLISRWSGQTLPGPVEHSILLTNSDPRPISLTLPPTTALALRRQSNNVYYHWWVEKASGDVAPFGPRSDLITNTYSKSLVCGPYSTDMETRDEIPWLCIQNATANSVVYGGIEYSGWTEIYVKKNSSTITANLGLQQQHYGTTTRTPVASGGSLSYPPVFVGVYSGDVEGACNRLHRWVENHLRPAAPNGVTPLIVNNSWCLGLDINDSTARSMINDCAALGMEMFHIDAGWYNAVGDWQPNVTKFPNGLASVANYAHSKGVKFGLWVAWAQGGGMKAYTGQTLSVFDPGQAPWFTMDFSPDWTAQPFSGATVCLADSGAQGWARNELNRIIDGYSLDMLEHDQPMIPDQGCSRTFHGHTAGDWVDTSRAACDGYYSVYDAVRSQHPNLYFEDCVNGGRLIDYGVLKRVHYFSVTDVTDAINLRQAFYDTSYPIPPSMIELYLDTSSDLNTRLFDYPGGFVYMLRSVMLGWPTIQCNTGSWTAGQRNAAKREFGIFKQKLRPLIANGNIYHVLPRPDDASWDGIEYFDPATGKGALYVFRPYSQTGTMTVQLRGLDVTKNYLVESTDGSVATQTLSGSDLVTTGLTITLPGENSSDLIFLTQQ